MRHGRIVRGRCALRGGALFGAGVLLGTSLVLAVPASAQQPLGEASVKVSVLRVTPAVPIASHSPQPLSVSISLTNMTDQSLATVTVRGERGDPINSQDVLDQAIANPRRPDPSLSGQFRTVDSKPVTTALGPHATVIVEYRSSTDIPQDAGLCICHNAIYPLFFAVHTDVNGTDTTVGAGQTYLPVFKNVPKPVQVSWVWPIIDRPHRLTSDAASGGAVFTDDDLAISVANGRLDRVLSVVEQVGSTVPMTLVIDPELIDELAVMSGPYRFESGAKTLPGAGSEAAKAWLARLRAALFNHPGIDVTFTPPADPDVESLTRNRLGWTAGLSQPAQVRVAAALGGRSRSSDVGWPADGMLSDATLSALVRQGASTVIVSDTTLSGGAKTAAGNALAPLQTPAGSVFAAVTSRSIQRYVAPVISVAPGAAGRAALPELVSEVAVHAVADPTNSHFVIITAPRDIDPSDLAVQAIRATAAGYWSTPITLNAAAPPTIEPADHGRLVPPARNSAGLSSTTISTAQNVTQLIDQLKTMLSATDATALLGALPGAIQRAESTEWRTDPADGDGYAHRLNVQLGAIESGVQILKPSTGTYTLASSNSPLPVTILNTLPVAVSVRVRVTSVNDLPGFSATDLGVQVIPAKGKLPLHIPTHVERAGRFVVQAELLTPSGAPLGTPVSLKVHSTALGTIGVVITIASAAVLALALLVRFIRRMRDPRPRPLDPEAVPA